MTLEAVLGRVRGEGGVKMGEEETFEEFGDGAE